MVCIRRSGSVPETVEARLDTYIADLAVATTLIFAIFAEERIPVPMAIPQTLESLFQDLQLDVVIPAGAFPVLPANSDQAELQSWWQSVTALPVRDTAFLGE